MATNDVHLRWMIRRDLPEMMAIEADCFLHPWSESDFADCMRRKNMISIVAIKQNQIVGYMLYSTDARKMNMINIAIAKTHQRCGIGSQMIDMLVGKLSRERRRHIFVNVVESNLAAQLFFKSHGFLAISILKDFYDLTDEDCYLMHYEFEPKHSESTRVSLNRISHVY